MTTKKATAVPAATTNSVIDSADPTTTIKQEVNPDVQSTELTEAVNDKLAATEAELEKAKADLAEATEKLIEAEISAEEKGKRVKDLEEENTQLQSFLSEPEPKMPKGLSIRETLSFGGNLVIKDCEAIVAKLKQLEAFALENKRPAMHFSSYQRQILALNDSFKRNLR